MRADTRARETISNLHGNISAASAYVMMLAKECNGLREALEKIADPRKRHHSEPDKYTELGCVMQIAQDALDACRVEGK